MSITRRQFLTNSGVSLPATALVSTRAMSIGEVGLSDSDLLHDWPVVHDQFSPEYIHLATFALASHPRPVREAIQKYRRALDEPEAENLPHISEVNACRDESDRILLIVDWVHGFGVEDENRGSWSLCKLVGP
jgi:hypothetical protein